METTRKPSGSFCCVLQKKKSKTKEKEESLLLLLLLHTCRSGRIGNVPFIDTHEDSVNVQVWFFFGTASASTVFVIRDLGVCVCAPNGASSTSSLSLYLASFDTITNTMAKKPHKDKPIKLQKTTCHCLKHCLWNNNIYSSCPRGAAAWSST